MGLLNSIKKIVFKAVATKVIQTNSSEIFKFDENNERVSISKFNKLLTWKLFYDRIESTDKFGIKSVLRIALVKNQSQLPEYLVFRVNPVDAENARINVITVTEEEITAGNLSDSQVQVFFNK